MAIHPFDPLKRDRVGQLPLDKVLLGVGISYLGWVILWLSSQQAGHGLANSAVTPSPAQDQANRDRPFIAYLQKSLEAIKRNKASQSQQNLPTPIITDSNPINLAPIHHSSLATRLIPKNNSSPGTSPLPPQPIKSESLTQILIPPPPIRSPQIETKPSSPATLSALSSSSSAHRLPSPMPPLSSSVQTPANHVLVGLLESGDQSSVLVTFNGITRRFAIGETLGSSGWRLVSVSNQRAMVSHNGVTRALDVGQEF